VRRPLNGGDRTEVQPDYPERTEDFTLTSVHRALRVLEILASERNGMTITELSSAFGINKGLVHRMLMNLSELHYVYKDDLSHRYRLSMKLISLAFRQVEMMGIYDTLLPILRELARETGELSEIGWIENSRMVVVAKVDSPQKVRVVDRLGEELRPHATAAGKTWLAFSDSELVSAIVAERGLPAITDYTITDRDQLLRQLEEIREQGFAVNYQESALDVSAIGVPIFKHEANRQVLGAVSVAAPLYRDIHSDSRVVELAKKAADDIGMVWPFLDSNP
jgi:DNA-binding IclR family transcriptional regulator